MKLLSIIRYKITMFRMNIFNFLVSIDMNYVIQTKIARHTKNLKVILYSKTGFKRWFKKQTNQTQKIMVNLIEAH